MKRISLLVLIAAVSLPAVAQEAELKAIVLGTLKDPDSAQFRNLRVVSGGAALCGEVNAKNSYGGYNGFKSFVADSEGVAWQGDGSTPSETYKQYNHNTYWPKGKYRGCL